MPRFPLTILHLTDLHFGATGHYWTHAGENTELELPEHDRRGLLGGLVRDLGRERAKPDMIVVTGDLLDCAQPDGVELAAAFLGDIADRLGLPRARIVLVPGNHDVIRGVPPEHQYERFDRIRDVLYGVARKPVAPTVPAYERVERFDYVDDLGVEVIGFNSCEGLDPTAGEDHGSIGVAQRDVAERILQPTAARELVRIAAMHHHLASPVGTARADYSVMYDAAATRKWLAEHRFQLALHGHQHVAWQENHIINGWSLAIGAGPSAGVASYGRARWLLRLGYQLIIFDDAHRGRRVLREYDPGAREWVVPAEGEKSLQFGVMPVVARTAIKGSLRRLMDRVLVAGTDFQAFCNDYFPETHRRFMPGMDRPQMTTILLEREDAGIIVQKLRLYDRHRFDEHAHLIEEG